MAVVRVTKEALDLGEGLQDLALRRWDLGEEERDLRAPSSSAAAATG